MFDLIAGFVKSQTLFALVEMGVLSRLSHGPLEASAAVPDIPGECAAVMLGARWVLRARVMTA